MIIVRHGRTEIEANGAPARRPAALGRRLETLDVPLLCSLPSGQCIFCP